MYKIIEAGGWDRLQDQGLAHILPVQKSGSLSQNDRSAFFRKTAASEKFLHEIGNLQIGDGDIPVHVSAIGAAEYYGPNRKGDAFAEQVCRDRHHTFVTEGRNYVHHRNRDPDRSYGKIASSCYNEAMHRIELLVLTNGSEAAARRNGGLIVPDEFLSQLEKNAAVPVSMGCTIDHDVCAICGNRARTRAEYCDENTCRDPKTGEHFPGCRHGLMKIAADGRMQFVYNVEPTFFDLSYVGVPADRAGYGYRADYLPYSHAKTASVTVESARVLELPPYTGWTHHYRAEMTDMLSKLAAYEQSKSPIIRYDHCFQDESLGRKLAGLLPPTRWAALGLLAREGVLLSPENFCTAFSTDKTAELGPYAALRPRYRDDPILATVLAALDHDAYTKLAGLHCPAAWIRQFVYEDSSPGMAALIGTIRAAQHAYKGVPKSAAANQKNSDAYALYSAAALCRFPPDKKEWGIKLAVWQTFE